MTNDDNALKPHGPSRSYLTIDIDAVLALPIPFTDMALPELKTKLAELKETYKAEFDRIVGDSSVTLLANREDRVTTAEHCLRRVAAVINQINVQLANMKKKPKNAS